MSRKRADIDLAMAYHMGYEDALARRKPMPSKTEVLESYSADFECVVRCRDCELFNDYHGKCHRTATIIDVDGNVYLTDEENGYLSMADAVPDGYCAWGVRKEDE